MTLPERPLNQVEENVEKGMSFLARIAHQVQKNAPDSKPRSDYLGPLTMKELVLGRDHDARVYKWQGDDVLLRLSYMLLTVITPEWHAQFYCDQVTGSFNIRLVGDPDRAQIDIEKLLDDETYKMVRTPLAYEVEKRMDPYQRLPIPGKKKAEKKTAASNAGVDVESAGPVFGKPETGKKRRK